jgi:hypothetical protein
VAGLLWLAEALGENPAILSAAIDDIDAAGPRNASQCAALRRHVPWGRIEQLIALRTGTLELSAGSLSSAHTPPMPHPRARVNALPMRPRRREAGRRTRRYDMTHNDDRRDLANDRVSEDPELPLGEDPVIGEDSELPAGEDPVDGEHAPVDADDGGTPTDDREPLPDDHAPGAGERE